MVKRYVKEPGSNIVKDIYLKAYPGELIIAFSSWNIGEVLAAFDKAYSRGILDHKNFSTAKNRFLLETRRLARLGVLRLIPVRFKLLVECWALLEKCHVYQADALQIASAKAVNAVKFFTGDKGVCRIADEEGLNTVLTM